MENPFFKSKLAYAAPEIVVFEGENGGGPFAGSEDNVTTSKNSGTGNDTTTFTPSI